MIHASEAMHTDELDGHFRVWPAYTNHEGNLPAGFEYRSDAARQLTVEELRRMIEQSQAEATE